MGNTYSECTLRKAYHPIEYCVTFPSGLCVVQVMKAAKVVLEAADTLVTAATLTSAHTSDSALRARTYKSSVADIDRATGLSWRCRAPMGISLRVVAGSGSKKRLLYRGVQKELGNA